MGLRLIGTNHNTAPVELREKLAISEPCLPDALRRLLLCPGVTEGLVLSTCNRVELLVADDNVADLRGFFHDYGNFTADELDLHVYEYSGKEAVRHVFRVAASLDSMVLGESQILGQLKRAYAAARLAGGIGPQLDQLLNHAFAVAKRVRADTLIGSAAVSIASVAVQMAERIFGALRCKRVLLVGAGEMGELVARHSLARGAWISVVNRTYERAVELASALGGTAARFDELRESCYQADIVICSTGSPVPIFGCEDGKMILRRRKNRPICFIDIGVPRDVDPEMGEIEGIFVYNLDDLREIASEHRTVRKEESRRAEAIVDSEVDRYCARLLTLEVVPTIVSLQEHFETIRLHEIQRAQGLLASLTPEQHAAVEWLMRSIVKKIAHSPIMALKTSARGDDSAAAIAAINYIFNLPPKREVAAIQTSAEGLSRAGDEGQLRYSRGVADPLGASSFDRTVHQCEAIGGAAGNGSARIH